MSDQNKSEFKRQRKQFALTWSQCPASKYDALRVLESVGRLSEYCIAQEHHQDGNTHLHAYAAYAREIRSSKPRLFDINYDGKNYHPNEEGINEQKGGKEGWINYCIKEDPAPLIEHRFDDSNPTNFRKRKADFDSWLDHTHSKQIKYVSQPSILLPDGTKHLFTGKARGLFIYGPPNTYKSNYFIGWYDESDCSYKDGVLSSFSHYPVTSSVYPFDNYRGEQFIVYDDVIPSLNDLKLLTAVNKDRRAMPGHQRYYARFKPPMVMLHVIIICNSDVYEASWMYDRPQGFEQRFKFIEIKSPIPGLGGAQGGGMPPT